MVWIHTHSPPDPPVLSLTAPLLLPIIQGHRRNAHFLFLLCALVIAASSISPPSPAKIHCDLLVDLAGHDNSTCGGQSAPCATIQQAVWNACDGFNVCVRGGPRAYRCPKGGQGVLVDKSLSLFSLDGQAEVDCAGRGRAFWFRGSSAVTVAGFTMRNGLAERGGAILAECAEVTVANCSFINNAANTTGGGALCFHNSAKIDIANSVFERNSVSANSAQAKGGGAILVLAADASPVVYAFSGNLFTENMALSPGAIALETATVVDSSVLVTNNRFEDNQGGAISLSVTLVQNSTLAFTANVMTNSGGAVAISGNPRIRPGVGVVSSTVIFVGNQVQGNIKRADGPGLALALDSTVDSRLVVENNTFDANVGQGHLGGAALLVQSFSAVSASSVLIGGNHFHNNSATNPQASGGAVRWQFLFQQSEQFDCIIILQDNVMIGSFLPYPACQAHISSTYPPPCAVACLCGMGN